MEPVEARFLFPKIDALNEFHLERNQFNLKQQILVASRKNIVQIKQKNAMQILVAKFIVCC